MFEITSEFTFPTVNFTYSKCRSDILSEIQHLNSAAGSDIIKM